LDKTNHIIDKHREQRIFRLFRNSLRFNLGIFYLAFTAVDYLYLPKYWVEGLSLRLLWYLYVCASVYLLKSKQIRKRSNLVAAVMLVIMCWGVNWLIYRSGGYSSYYITGLFLINVIGLQVVGFPRKWAIGVDIVCLVPTLGIIWATAGSSHWKEGLIQSAFVFLTIGLAWFYKATGDRETFDWAIRQLRSLQELELHRRTEYLKRSFPAFIRKQIESGKVEMPRKRVMNSAVLGFVDISSSTSIANELTLSRDWDLKERFIESVITRGTENNLIILSQQGDGCFFLANYQDDNGWPLNVIAFFENLLLDYQGIKAQIGINTMTHPTGIKFGISMGSVIIGFIGKDQPSFTANGPAVNLASRLCGEAGRDELVVSSQVWEVLKQFIAGWHTTEETFKELKGFDIPVPAVRIQPRLRADKDRPRCTICDTPLTVVSTPEGFLDVRCTNGHSGEAAGIVLNVKQAA
jgi:class 3 adenylate cyclase